MSVNCPHCGKQLKLSDKLRGSLQKLKPGQAVRLKCIQCGSPFQLDAGAVAGPKSAGKAVEKQKKRREGGVRPPTPPDVSWLKEGVFEDREVVEEIPLALVLVPEDCGRAEVMKAVEALGYRAEMAESAESAMEKMEFVNYSSVILHTAFEPGGLRQGVFHNYMRSMAMNKRRYVFYTLIGSDMHTLYDLEALANSANIVVNQDDVPYFGTILRKAIPDYEALFGPLMEEMRIAGK